MMLSPKVFHNSMIFPSTFENSQADFPSMLNDMIGKRSEDIFTASDYDRLIVIFAVLTDDPKPNESHPPHVHLANLVSLTPRLNVSNSMFSHKMSRLCATLWEILRRRSKTGEACKKTRTPS